MNLKDDRLFDLFNESSIGLFHGNTGLGLYLGLTNRSLCPPIIRLSSIRINKVLSDLSIRSGLLGIVPILDILAFRHSKSHVSQILRETDSILYKKIGYEVANCQPSLICDSILYICYRLRCTPIAPTHKQILLALLDLLLNKSLSQFTSIIITDHKFSLRYPFAFYLFCFLCGVMTANDSLRYKKKVIPIIPCLIEHFPTFDSNRLYYLIVLLKLKDMLNINDVRLDAYIHTLKTSLSIKNIISSAMNNIYMGHGLSGIYLLCRFYPEFKDQLPTISRKISQMIYLSTEMSRLSENTNYLKNHLGIWDGIGGIKVVKLLMKIDGIRNGK